MKKVMLLCVALFFIVAAHAQNNKVISAYNYNNDGYLDKAKKNIDEACQHETTMTKPKTWKYRGDIYMNIQYTKDPKYKALSTDAIGEAYNSYLKALEFDTKKEYEEEIANAMGQIRVEFFNQSVAKFQEKNYADAAERFAKAASVLEKVNKLDTLSLYYATLSFEMARQKLLGDKDTNNPKTEEYYNLAVEGYVKLIGVDYKQPNIYSNLAGLYTYKKLFDKALEIVEIGKGKYANNFALVVAEANIYLGSEQLQKALEVLQLAIKLDPTNPVLYYTAATKLDVAGEYEKAEEYYKKAIELKPDYSEAFYGLGSMYYNQSVSFFLIADKMLPDDPELEIITKKITSFREKAVPLLEQALNFSPNDISILNALKVLYPRLNMTEKYEIVNKKIKELQQKK